VTEGRERSGCARTKLGGVPFQFSALSIYAIATVDMQAKIKIKD